MSRRPFFRISEEKAPDTFFRRGGLALAAPDNELHRDGRAAGQPSTADQTAAQFQRACRAVVDGRRAARLLASWSRCCELNESDVQVLWTLWSAAPASLDQSTLAERLAISPAQVSATVERLRTKLCIERLPSSGDRRRNLWQVTAGGRQMLDRILADVAHVRQGAADDAKNGAVDVLIISEREDAA
jgi:DNA-binding MarR family transcriptional regulator